MINSSGCRQQRVLSAASKIFSTSSTIIWQHSYNDAIAVCNTVIAVNEYRQEAVWWIWLSVKNWSRTAAAAHGGPSQAGLGDFLHGNARHTPPVRSPLVICSFRHGRAGTRWQLATGNWPGHAHLLSSLQHGGSFPYQQADSWRQQQRLKNKKCVAGQS